jgi:phosphatidylglycerophosphatase A
MSRAKDVVVVSLASAFGLGYVPKAPGTFGTLAALPLWWLSASWPVLAQVGLALAVTVFAIVVAGAAERVYGGHDAQRIVIDEVAGMLCTVIAVPWSFGVAVAAFALFRVLDATKPPPIRWFDQHVGGGFGVVIDDVVAGLIGCALLHGGRLVLGGWW